MAAGALNRRFRFDKREDADDGFGNTKSAWTTQFTRWAGIKYRRGGEAVIAGRLEGRQPAVLRVRKDAETWQIANDWRCIDEFDETVFAVKEMPVETDDRLYLEFLIERGVAA